MDRTELMDEFDRFMHDIQVACLARENNISVPREFLSDFIKTSKFNLLEKIDKIIDDNDLKFERASD